MYRFTEPRNIFFDICSEELYKPIRVNIVSQDIKTGPPLSPILILNKVDMLEFCRVGKELDDYLSLGSMIPVIIYKNYFQDFLLDFKSISSSDFFDWLLFCFYKKKKHFRFLKKRTKKYASGLLFLYNFRIFYRFFFFKYLLSFEKVEKTSLRFFFQSYIGTLKCRFKTIIWYRSICFIFLFFGKKFINSKQTKYSIVQKQDLLFTYREEST